MKMKTVKGQSCRKYVQERIPFRNHSKSLWGCFRRGADGDQLYVVYSYRESFPIYAYSYTLQQWFRNEDKFSVTTSKHQGQAHPLGTPYPLSLRAIITLVEGGGVNFTAKYLSQGV